MSKYTYGIECPCGDKWNRFIKDQSLGYCQGFLNALKGQAPRLHYRIVRDDGKVIDEVLPQDSVNIGMVAGWPTAEQYERAGLDALNRADQIRKNQQARDRRQQALGEGQPDPAYHLNLMLSIPDLPPEHAWRNAAIVTGLYQANTDVSTPDKWLTAQTNAAAALLSEVENLRQRDDEQRKYILKLLEDHTDPK